MAQAQARKSKSKAGDWKTVSIFIALVIVSGVALGFTNNLQNPFDVFARIGTFVATGGQSTKVNNTPATPKPAATVQAAVVAAEKGKTDAGKTEGGKAGATMTEAAKAATGKTETTKTEAGKTEGSKAEAAKTPAANGQAETGKTAATEGAKPEATKAATTQTNRNAEMQPGQYGRVLFQFWFLAAIVATMMLVGPAVGFVVKKLQKPAPAKKAPATRPVQA